jgi:fibronectin-binding autotransporter adhesin
VTLGGDVSVSGTTSAIVLGSTTAGNGLNFLLGADRTFSVASGNTLTVNNVVSGANALTKTGTGQLTLAGANTYTGTTTVNAGTLLLNASGTLASGSNLVVNSTTAATTAAVTLGAGFTQTIGTLTFSGAGGAASNNNVTLNTGSTLTLGGTVTYDGTNNPLATTIAGPGTLALGGNRTFDIGNSTANPDFRITAPISGTGFVLTKDRCGPDGSVGRQFLRRRHHRQRRHVVPQYRQPAPGHQPGDG